MSKYKVSISLDPMEFEVEADDEQHAEIIAMENFMEDITIDPQGPNPYFLNVNIERME